MKMDRWKSLMKDDDLALTEAEIEQGWHFCCDWDGLLIGPGMTEMEHCSHAQHQPRAAGEESRRDG
jgi:hypothetical protein